MKDGQNLSNVMTPKMQKKELQIPQRVTIVELTKHRSFSWCSLSGKLGCSLTTTKCFMAI